MKPCRVLILSLLMLLAFPILFSCAKNNRSEEYAPPTETYAAPPTASIDRFDGKNNGIVLCGNTLYYATDAGLFRFDEQENAGVPILEVPVDFVEKHHGAMFAVSLAERCVYRIENDTAQTALSGLDERITADDTFSFAVCNDYFVFLGRDPEKTSGGPIALFLIDRMSGETRAASVASSISRGFGYEGNRIFLYNYGRSTDDCYFSVYDTETEREEDRIPISQMGVSDAEYCPYIDSLLIYTRDDITRKMTLKQLALTDRLTRTLTSYGDAADANTKGMIAAETNIVCCGLTDSETLRYFNLNEEHPSVTVAVYGYPQGALQVLMNLFKEKRGIDVNLIQIDYGEVEKLNTKLLAQDDDIDVYYTMGLTEAYYILRDVYCDLKQFDTLSANLSRCASLIEAAATYNGKVFGVPTEFGLVDTAAEGNLYNNSFYQYMAREIDLTEKAYRDGDGEALKTLYRHYRAYPNDDRPTPRWGDFKMVWCSYMMMNPASRHKEEAALFLNDLLALELGDFDEEAASQPLMALVTKYPENTDFGDVSVRWKFTDMNIFNMIRDGLNAVESDEMTDEEAKELARRIRMVVME
ncbi:MAG: hypothetical protein E7576_14655 [Ruminococcaceae bacterium]|nr:hypothetical protein [Oscillospiraceae bacterium]